MYELSRAKVAGIGDKLAVLNEEALSALQLEEFSSRNRSSTTDDTTDGAPNLTNCTVAEADLSPVLKVLRDGGALTTIAEPSVVTTSGRPANYSSIGEAPVVVREKMAS
ncbi:MAG: hypothetical protein R3C10_18360 [Pirellulales bacterium]